MKFFRSIRWRLQLWYGLLLLLVLAGFGFTAMQLARSHEFQRVDEELQSRLRVVEDATRYPVGRRPNENQAPPPPPERSRSGSRDQNDPPPPPEPDSPRRSQQGNNSQETRELNFRRGERDLFDGPEGYYYFVWWYGTTPDRSTIAPQNIPKPDPRAGVRLREEWREAFVERLPSGHLILVGRSVAANLSSLHRQAWKLAGFGAIVLGFGLLGGWWFVTQSIRPIEDISTTAEKISSGDLSHRINVANAETELGRLAGVLNSTFARLEAAFAQQARFTADAAHELRTPVTVMLTHLQSAIETSCASEEHRETFDACLRAAQRMRRLIESLLELARLDAGQLHLRPQEFELSQVINECVELVHPLAEQRRITIQNKPESVQCHGDPDRLGQVVLNLLTNAIHYNRDGGEVRVDSKVEDRSVLVSISDNGCGISHEHLSHIFDRFYRVDKARTTSVGRTGLGLAISKAIIEAHHGKLSVTSEFGKGTTFKIELPRPL